MYYGQIREGTVAFEPTSPNDGCPRCNDTCSCDNCTARRGEVYKFARGAPKIPLTDEQLGSRIPRTPSAVHAQQNPYHVIKQMVIEPTTYYATMYDLTGRRVARTFLGADGNNQVVVTQPVLRRRVFIGEVQDDWELGPDPVVFVEPTPLLGKRKRGFGSGPFYIGEQSVLSLRVRPRPARLRLRLCPRLILLFLGRSCSCHPSPFTSATPPPAPVPDAFASPLTSVADSETIAEDTAVGESEMAGEKDVQGESETAGEGDAQAESQPAGPAETVAEDTAVGDSEMAGEKDVQGDSETAGEGDTQAESEPAGPDKVQAESETAGNDNAGQETSADGML
ncbi:hypothetical protein B0H13DRAFT_778881 [Mycena leptocephala]|nr:hypothetical protein B0H13DRAFT_778881 [Mycena leptocephala]